MKNIILIMFVACVFFSCTSTDSNIENCGRFINVAYESFKYCGNLKEDPTQSSFLIINSAEEFQKLFISCQTVATLPDFTQKRIVGLLAGSKPTGGYTIKIESVVEDNCQVTVEYFEKEPKKGDTVTMSTTYPSDYIVLPKSPKPILFKKINENDYIIIGRLSSFCLSNCASFYRIEDEKTIKFLDGNNTVDGAYKILDTKENFLDFVSHIPQEIIALKGKTKEFKNDLISDGGGYYFEYHQGDVVTKISFINFYDQDKSQENLVRFMEFVKSRISFLDSSK